MLTKWCVKCEKEFPATTDHFYKDRSSKDGLQYRCKGCVYKPKREVLPDGYRRCSDCEEVKPLDDFVKDPKRKYGYDCRCKTCHTKRLLLRKQLPEVRRRYAVYSRAYSRKKYSSNRQPQPGDVYIIQFDRFFKIGRSVDPDRRLKEINGFLPVRAILLHRIKSDDAIRAELQLHDRFSDRRTNGEWFELHQDDVQELISISELMFGK